MKIAAAILAAGCLLSGPALAADNAVAIVLGEHPAPLEHFAAKELSGYLRKLFGQSSEIKSAADRTDGPCFVLGTADDNSSVARLIPRPNGDQTIVLKRTDGDSSPVFVIAGGSDAAVLWGVYELAERYGVRYLLHGDVFPDDPGRFRFLDLDVTLRPNMSIRSWRLMNADPMGPESWSLAENERFIDQLAKMKFNRVYLSFWPWQSYSDYRYHGVTKTTGTSFFGQRFPIDDQTIGRKLFAKMRAFDNPEFAGATTYEQRREAARRLARGILDHAKERGMEAGIMVQPLDFPVEFRSILPGASVHKTLDSIATIAPGPTQSIDDPNLIQLVVTVIRSYLRDYPKADWLYFNMPEHRGWTGMGERCWDILNRKYHLSSTVTFDALVRQAGNRTTYARGTRGEDEVRGDLAGLYFLDRVIRENGLLLRPGKPDLHLVYSNVSEELCPYLPKLMPPGSELMMFVDYTASRVADQTATLRRIPARDMPTTLIYTLADDNVGILPQVATGSLHLMDHMLEEGGWEGFQTRFWIIGDLDPPAYYLHRSAWDDSFTPKSAYADLFGGIAGSEAIGMMTDAMDQIEGVTRLLDHDDLSIAFPVAKMLIKHYQAAAPIPARLLQARDGYEQALIDLRRARYFSQPQGYDLIDYDIGRLEFAVSYLDAVKFIRLAAMAEKDGRAEDAVQWMNRTVEAIVRATNSMVRVTRDNSDRGVVCVLNEFACKPAKDLLAKLSAAAANAHR